MNIGSTAREEGQTENEKIASKMRSQTATIQGCSAEIQILKQQVENLYAHKDKLERLVATQAAELAQLKQQFGVLLQQKLGGGPTA